MFTWASVFFLKREPTLFQILFTQCLLLRASTQGHLNPQLSLYLLYLAGNGSSLVDRTLCVTGGGTLATTMSNGV